MSIFPFAGNVNFAHLVEVVSASLLNCKVTYFPYFMCFEFFDAILMLFLNYHFLIVDGI